MSVGFGQLLIICAVLLVLFGAGRLGAIGKGLGEGIYSFKKGLAGDPKPEPPPKEPLQLPAKTGPESEAEAPTAATSEPAEKKSDEG